MTTHKMESPLTERQIRRMAKEEALKVQKDVLKEISEIKSTLSRLERLLLGEVGSNEEDTLKARANFAYIYARRNSDAHLVEQFLPIAKWYQDMSELEAGCNETKLESLGKILAFYSNIKWIMGIIGFTTVINSIPIIQQLLRWMMLLAD